MTALREINSSLKPLYSLVDANKTAPYGMSGLNMMPLQGSDCSEVQT